jgi:hypothetical protein
MQLKMKIQLFTPRPLQGLSWDLGKRARKSDVAPDFFFFFCWTFVIINLTYQVYQLSYINLGIKASRKQSYFFIEND